LIIWAFLPADLGLYAVVLAVGSLATFLVLSPATFVIRDIASNVRNKKKIISTSLFAVVSLASLIGIGSFFAINFFGRYLGVGADMLILAKIFIPFYIIFHTSFNLFNSIFQGLQDFKKSSLILAGQPLVLFLVVGSLYFTRNLTVFTLLLATVFSYVVPCMFSFFWLLEYMSLKMDHQWLKSAFKETLMLYPSTIFKRITLDGLYLILGAVTGRVQVGYLKFTHMLATLMATVPTLLTQVLYPVISEMVQFKEKVSRVLNDFVRYTFTYQVFMTIIGILFFREILVILGLTKYSPAFTVFVLVMMWWLVGIPGSLNIRVLLAKKRTSLVTKCTFASFLTFIVMLPTVFYYGIIGAGVCLVARALVVVAFGFKYVSRYVDLEIPVAHVIKSVALSVTVMAEILLLKAILPDVIKIPVCAIALLVTWLAGHYYFVLEKRDKVFLKEVLGILRVRKVAPPVE
jgi:O-antigen/teichoic acid export membrane protein